MTDEDAVGSGMGNERKTVAGFFDVPHGQFVFDAIDAPLGQELIGASVNSFGEVTYGLTTNETVPTLCRRAILLLTVRRLGLVGGAALPDGAANLFEPWLDHFAAALRIKNWGRRLTCPQERRNVDVIKVFGFKSIGKTTCLTMTARGEWRIVLTEPIAHPLGFGMTNQREMHVQRLVVGCRGRWRRRRRRRYTT